MGLNTPFGAIALDVTHSRAEIPDDKTYQGQSYRLTWNKLIEATDTSFNVAAYRYSTQNYLGLNDALQLIDEAKYGDDDQRNTMNNFARLKNRITLSISQPLQYGETDYGSFYLSGSLDRLLGDGRQPQRLYAGLRQRLLMGQHERQPATHLG